MELPKEIKEKLDERFKNTHIFSCPICGEGDINSVILSQHLKNCLNFLNIYSGNGPLSFNSNLNANSSPSISNTQSKKRKMDEETEDISFPLNEGYYNNGKKSNYEKGKCSFVNCVARTSGQHIERSIYIHCKQEVLHFCK